MAEILLNLDQIQAGYPGRTLFADLCWEIQDRQRIGLVGPNGAGKSTLFKLISKELPPEAAMEAGNIFRQSGLTWGRLAQEPRLADGRSVLTEALTAVPQIAAIEAKLAALEGEMGDPAVYEDGTKLQKVLARHEKELHALDQLDGASYRSRVKEMLVRLGFGPEQWETPTDVLSGGQKKLIMLAKLLLQKPRLLLLDEPDNHLDLGAKQRLEQVIHDYPGGVVIISHDRYLLDEVATHIAELENGRLTLFPGNYTAYSTERELRRLRQQQLYAAQQKEIARIEAAIARFEQWASIVVDERHIRQARSRQKMLDKLERVEKVTAQRRMTLNLQGWRGSKKVVELEKVSRLLPNGRLIFDALEATLWHGARVGLVGPNGAGKSFLLKQILAPETVDEGVIKIGPSVKIGYYAQENETLQWERDLISEIRQTAPVSRETAVAFLFRFLFSYDQMQGPIAALSGGERSRLQLAKLVLEQPNLLLLDEPTNNLDIASIEVLEEALDEFEGTLLVVSHDRYFLDQVVDEVIELQDGRFRFFQGGYTDYLGEKASGAG
jgi:ATP-binding cassette subfamily F protein 3